MRAAELARERDWEVLCDPNLRPNRWTDHGEMVSVISSLVEASSVVKLNEREALELTGRDELEDAGEALLELGPSQVVVTRGGEGALIFCTGHAEPVPGAEAQVVDTTGAGDSVAGVIAAALARGLTPRSGGTRGDGDGR